MNINSYWIKDTTRKEVITKTQIPNTRNFDLFANYYNLMDKKGMSFSLCFENDLDVEKLYRKNVFDYIVLEHYNQKELFILPNENIVEYANRIASKVDECKSEKEVMKLLIYEMN